MRILRMPRLIPKRYIPNILSRRDAKTVRRELVTSRRLYRKGIYYTRRRNVKTFPSKKSKHIIRAERIYKIDKIVPSLELAKKTGCSVRALSDIERKGQGAYFSSGSRPNQSAHSWGRARLASAITGGKSAAVDFSILDRGCNHSTSRAHKMARTALKKYGNGRRHTARVAL
jgi:hypothetical protein